MKDTKLETLFGGRAASVLHEDGTALDVFVRQLPIRDYPAAFKVVEDEFAFTAFCTTLAAGGEGRGEVAGTAFVQSLRPESYELLQAAAREVNEKGFFAFAARQQARADAVQKAQLAAMSEMPPEMLKLAIEIGK